MGAGSRSAKGGDSFGLAVSLGPRSDRLDSLILTLRLINGGTHGVWNALNRFALALVARQPCSTVWWKTTPTPAKLSTPATYRLSSRFVHPSLRGWDRGICAPVTRMGLPGCVKRKVRMEAVYARVSVPERMMKPS